MADVLISTGLRLLVCCVAAWGLWRLLGAVGLVVAAPLFGVLLARPILDLSAELRDSARALAYADVEGHHFEHRGWRIRVVEDDRHHRWVSVADVRKVVPGFPRDAVLQRQWPDSLRPGSGAVGSTIHADALLGHLQRATEPDAVRFRNWLERDVVRPAAAVRRRLGIRDEQSGS